MVLYFWHLVSQYITYWIKYIMYIRANYFPIPFVMLLRLCPMLYITQTIPNWIIFDDIYGGCKNGIKGIDQELIPVVHCDEEKLESNITCCNIWDNTTFSSTFDIKERLETGQSSLNPVNAVMSFSIMASRWFLFKLKEIHQSIRNGSQNQSM